MAEAEQREQVGIVLDGPAGQRFAERLTRAGVVAHAISLAMFEQQADAGQMYLAPLSLAAASADAARRGAHVCLIPPWPAETITIGASSVGTAEVEHRGAARYTSALETTGATGETSQPLKVLYREQLVGALGTALAESDAGEPLLATLPRVSNRFGYLMVTTLQLGITSAQTRFDDVARLVNSLNAWCIRHAEPVAHTIRERQGEASEDSQTEASAHILLLALALSAFDPLSTTLVRDTQPSQLVISAQRAYTNFHQIRRILGLAAESPAFDSGWAWLEAHGVLSVTEQGDAVIDRGTISHYSVAWQLGPRLRRLCRIGDMTW